MVKQPSKTWMQVTANLLPQRKAAEEDSHVGIFMKMKKMIPKKDLR